MNSEPRYYYELNEQVLGPLEPQAIHDMLRWSKITPDTLVCPEGSEDWQPLYLFEELSIPASEIGLAQQQWQQQQLQQQKLEVQKIRSETIAKACSMMIVASDEIPGVREECLESIGLVCANIVMTTHVGSHVVAGLKSIFGGEIGQYTELMTNARETVLKRLKERAASMGADAICSFRMTGNEIMQGCCEICAYGTAIKISNNNTLRIPPKQ